MSTLLFKNLIRMKIINNKLIAIYYLNNLSPQHQQIDLDKQDKLKQLIENNFISESEIKDDIIEYFNAKLKGKSYVVKLATQNFIHQENCHSFKL